MTAFCVLCYLAKKRSVAIGAERETVPRERAVCALSPQRCSPPFFLVSQGLRVSLEAMGASAVLLWPYKTDDVKVFDRAFLCCCEEGDRYNLVLTAVTTGYRVLSIRAVATSSAPHEISHYKRRPFLLPSLPLPVYRPPPGHAGELPRYQRRIKTQSSLCR